MNLKLRKEFAEVIGLKLLETKYGLSETGWEYQERREIDLALLTPKQLNELYKLLEWVASYRGVTTAMHEIRIWRKAQTDPDQWARNSRQMASLLKEYIGKVDGHRLFRHQDEHWLCFYVNHIEHVEKQATRDGVIPAHVNMYLAYEELRVRTENKLRFWEDDCRGKSPSKLLAENNLYPESEQLRAGYLKEREKFLQLAPQIGLQLDVWGLGTDNLDGNDDDDHDRYWHTTLAYPLGTPEEPGRAVVDVFKEKTERERERGKIYVQLAFWGAKSVKSHDDDDEADESDDDETPSTPAGPEIPMHPFLAIFDLKRHLRLQLYVTDCNVHVYDRQLAEKLVLRRELKDLVTLLIEHKAGGFQDIVKGKAGGAVVMLAGPPGTGKTLTAEVYAESEGRALYSVQCSQLGTNPNELENSLLKCFSRARRWNAVMLLDEADVYVHTRGNSLNQNAIVGVFLRVLEYQSAVLFLTTNRAQDVDDAVASRCIARLVYQVPDPADQAKIWKILAESSQVKLSQKSVAEIVKTSPDLSGRDVKNLLKLAMLMAKGKEITPAMVEFVKQFKPA